MTTPFHQLRIASPPGDPALTTIELDGQLLNFVTRVELVLDTDTHEAAVKLTIPGALVDLDVDAAAFVAAHTPRDTTAPDPDPPTACTATFLDARGNLRTCRQDAEHYDPGREPVWTDPLSATPGGWHTDGEAIWADHCHGATPAQHKQKAAKTDG
jgi:hypothetical protein